MKPQEPTRAKRNLVGTPHPVFLYTVEQISTMLHVPEKNLFAKYLWLDGREFGKQPVDRIRAVNIAPRTETPVWRIEEGEFIRWAIKVGFRTYDQEYLPR